MKHFINVARPVGANAAASNRWFSEILYLMSGNLTLRLTLTAVQHLILRRPNVNGGA